MPSLKSVRVRGKKAKKAIASVPKKAMPKSTSGKVGQFGSGAGGGRKPKAKRAETRKKRQRAGH